ncbi:MAG: hypothetical protein AW07_04728 [Candidatus Accumulibacter sp. SK-11]|nr:MAG: hypothetical protein AW07_04728 [Candidatus Accumulibacter sp. SK-11]
MAALPLLPAASVVVMLASMVRSGSEARSAPATTMSKPIPPAVLTTGPL